MSDWWPGGLKGAQGATRAGHFPQDTWRGQALGCWVYHFGHLDYEETPFPQLEGLQHKSSQLTPLSFGL